MKRTVRLNSLNKQVRNEKKVETAIKNNKPVRLVTKKTTMRNEILKNSPKATKPYQ